MLIEKAYERIVTKKEICNVLNMNENFLMAFELNLNKSGFTKYNYREVIKFHFCDLKNDKEVTTISLFAKDLMTKLGIKQGKFINFQNHWFSYKLKYSQIVGGSLGEEAPIDGYL